MRLVNVSDVVVNLADASVNHGTLKPKEVKAYPDSLMDSPIVDFFVQNGYVQVLKEGESVPKLNAPTKKHAQQHISLVQSKEVNLAPVTNTSVSAVKSGKDSIVPAIPPKGLPSGDEVEEGDGTLLVKQGSKSKPTKFVSMSSKDAEAKSGNKTNIIKRTQAGGDAPLAAGDDEAMIIVPSDIPGQGKAVPMRQLTEEQLGLIQKQTYNLLEGAKKDKALLQITNSYRGMDVDKKKSLIDNTSDLDKLQVMLNLENSGAIMMKIKGRINRVKKAAE